MGSNGDLSQLFRRDERVYFQVTGKEELLRKRQKPSPKVKFLN